MRPFVVVVVSPRLEAGIALIRVGPVFCIGPFAQGGLDEALCLAVSSGRVGSCAAVVELHLLAGVAELAGAVAGTVVGEQGADADAVAGEELDRRVQEADGGIGLLVGQHARKGHTGVIVNGHVQGQEAGMFLFAAQPPIAAQANLGEARHPLDIQVNEVAWRSVLVALHGWWREQIAPPAQPRAAQDAADGGRTGAGAARDLVAGHVPAAQFDDAAGETLGQAAGTAVRPRAAIQQPLDSGKPEARHPLGGGLDADAEGGRGRLPRPSLLNYESG